MKKFLCVFFATIIFLTSIVCAEEVTVEVGVGTYFTFGTYNGSQIVWRCVDIDDNGVLLLADKALCYKAFDGLGKTGSHLRGELRTTSGSNYWADSNMRSWLNSDAAAGEVVWLCGTAPDTNSVTDNPYDSEAGFLNGFTDEEKSLIKEVTQKSILDQYEYTDMSSYGSEPHIRKTSIEEVVQNYDTTAYGHMVTDKIFLPDVKQIKAVYDNRETLGDTYYIAKNMDGTSCRSWLRTPRATLTNSINVRYIATSGSVENMTANQGKDIGVRPAFYLSETAIIDTGDGTEESPYTVIAPTATSGDIQISRNLPAYTEDTTAWVLTTIRDSGGKIISVSFDEVVLSETAETPVTVTIAGADFIAGNYFDIYAWNTAMEPIIEAEHHMFAYVDGSPALLLAE